MYIVAQLFHCFTDIQIVIVFTMGEGKGIDYCFFVCHCRLQLPMNTKKESKWVNPQKSM
jgi:hypothetical protein